MKHKQMRKLKKDPKGEMNSNENMPEKERVAGQKYGTKQKKREWMAGAGLIACMIGFVIRIPLGRIIGDEGVGFFAAAMELYTVLSVIVLYAASRSVAILVKYRVKREMYKSARRVFHNAMFLAVVFGVLVTVGMAAFAESISSVIILERMSYLAVLAVAPAIFFSAVMGVYRGYFQGMGTMIPTVHSKLVVKLILLVSGLVFGSMLYHYGIKVADLLKNEQYAFAYGAMGAALGLSLACLLGVLHLLFIYMIYAGTFKQQMFRDNTKTLESNGKISAMLISTALPYAVCALLYNMNVLVDQRIYNYAVNVKSSGADRVLNWGVYYGKYSAIIGIAAILCSLAVSNAIPRIAQAFERQEYREAQVRLERIIHHLAIVAIPCAVLLAVLAEPIAGILFTGEVKTAVLLLQAGTAVIVLFAFTYLFMGLLQRIRKMKTVILGGLIAFAIHLLVIYVLIMKTNMGIMAVMCGSIAFYLVTCVTGFLGVLKYIRYSPDWIRVFAVTAIAAGVSGLVGMLLEKALLSLAGNLITLLVCVIVCVIIYHVLLLLLRGVRQEECDIMPGGRIIASLAKRLHLF